jgi:hypothetical protein
VAAAEGRLARLDASVERLVSHRLAVPVVVGAALLVYAAVSAGLPLQAGRDLPRYLLTYAQLFDADVVFPNALVARTPGTPVVTGVLLQAGPLVSEVGAALLYALSVLAWGCVARRFGPAACLATCAALLAYPGYVLLFHELASDALFAAAFALVALLFARAVERPTAAHAAALGLGVAAAVYARPVGQALALLGLVLVVVARGRRTLATVAFVTGLLVPLAALAVHNGIRGDDVTVVRGGSASLLFRTFVADRIVQPGNGDASEELGRAVAAGLLPHEPYRSRGIDLDAFFSSGSSRMHDDFTVLADRTWGWDDDYRRLGRVAREAIVAHPGTYARGVAGDVWRLLLWPVYAPVEEPAPEAAPPGAPRRTEQAAGLSDDEEPIPSSREAPYISTPDGRIREVWTSPNDHGLVFREPADRRAAAALDAEVSELLDGLPQRGQRPVLVRIVNDLSRLYPRPFMWLLVGLVAVLWRRPPRMTVPLALAAAALVVLVATSLAVYAVAEYAVPVVPAFVLLATVGVLGRYRPLRA